MVYSHDFPMISLMISGRGSAPTQEQRRQTAENLAGALSVGDGAGKMHCIIRKHAYIIVYNCIYIYLYAYVIYKTMYITMNTINIAYVS